MIRTFIFLLFTAVTLLVSAQQYPRGVLPGEDIRYQQILEKATLTRSFYTSAPDSYSLKSFAPFPKSQGPFGTCTAWATAYTARTILEAMQNDWTDRSFITQQAFSPIYQFRAVSDSENCIGAFTTHVVESLVFDGSVPINQFVYSTGDEFCPAAPVPISNDEIALNHRIEEFTKLWQEEIENESFKINRTRSSLASGNPVIVTMVCPKSFDTPDDQGLWNPTEDPFEVEDGRQHAIHAVCVVGYDDNKFGGAFEVQNSWGSEWGNEGYGWIKYEDYGKFIFQAFELVRLAKPEEDEPQLAGSLRLFDLGRGQDLSVSIAASNVKDGEKNLNYQLARELPSGSEMRMYLKSEQPAFVYMLGTGDKDKSVAQLFPVEGVSPAMNYIGNEVAIPSEDHYFKMDNTTGKSYIVLLYSKKKLDIDAIKNTFSKAQGSVSYRLNQATQGLLIHSKHIDASADKIDFTLEDFDTSSNAIGVILEFNQVN